MRLLVNLLQTVRLESQVKRLKTAAENLEKVEEELKAEKRKFQKEVSSSNNLISIFRVLNEQVNCTERSKS